MHTKTSNRIRITLARLLKHAIIKGVYPWTSTGSTTFRKYLSKNHKCNHLCGTLAEVEVQRILYAHQKQLSAMVFCFHYLYNLHLHFAPVRAQQIRLDHFYKQHVGAFDAEKLSNLMMTK